MKEITTYLGIENYLSSLKELPIKASYMEPHLYDPTIYIERTKKLLSYFGLDGTELPIVHIAGTSGKGTTAATMQASLTSLGHRVGLFVSPPLQAFTERFQVDGKLIEINELGGLLEKMKPVIDKMFLDEEYGRPSDFEVEVIIAYLYFLGKKCRYAVFEAGLGGQYDATNVFGNKIATILTTVGYDHAHILGDSLEKIAIDKAHIAVSQVPLITGVSDPVLLSFIQAHCKNANTGLEVVNPDKDRSLSVELVKGALKNANIEADVIEKRPSGRFEFIDKNPLVLLDGAHNPQKIEYLVSKLAGITYDNLHVVIGIASNKNLTDTLRSLLPLSSSVIITKTNQAGRGVSDPLEILEVCREHKIKNVSIVLDPPSALRESRKHAGKNDLILVTGSLHLVGDIREKYYPELEIALKCQTSW